MPQRARAGLQARASSRGNRTSRPGCRRARRVAGVALARRRLAASEVTADVVLADTRDLEMGRRFGGAVCPVNTLAHLAPDELQQHLHCMRRHLVADGRYLVQLD